MIFQKEQREKIKKDNPELQGVPAIAKKTGEIWRSMSEKEKKPYLELAEKDKIRWEKEMEDYNKRKEEEVESNKKKKK